MELYKKRRCKRFGVFSPKWELYPKQSSCVKNGVVVFLQLKDTRMFELLSFFHPFLYECATGIGYIGALGL